MTHIKQPKCYICRKPAEYGIIDLHGKYQHICEEHLEEMKRKQGRKK